MPKFLDDEGLSQVIRALDDRYSAKHSKELSTNQDLHTLYGEDKVGNYYALGSNNITNKPSGVDAFSLSIIRSASGYYTHILIASNVKTNTIFIETYKSGSWSEWIEIGNTDNKYLPLSGGTLTGNLTGNYITGTWLQTTASGHLGSKSDKIIVLDSKGWLYYRTCSDLLADIGAYAKPSGGIPETDLSTEVQTALSKAGTPGPAGRGISDIYVDDGYIDIENNRTVTTIAVDYSDNTTSYFDIYATNGTIVQQSNIFVSGGSKTTFYINNFNTLKIIFGEDAEFADTGGGTIIDVEFLTDKNVVKKSVSITPSFVNIFEKVYDTMICFDGYHKELKTINISSVDHIRFHYYADNGNELESSYECVASYTAIKK